MEKPCYPLVLLVIKENMRITRFVDQGTNEDSKKLQETLKSC